MVVNNDKVKRAAAMIESTDLRRKPADIPPLLEQRMTEVGFKTQRSLAVALELSDTTFGRNLRGEQRMSLEIAMKLVDILKFDMSNPADCIKAWAMLSEINHRFRTASH